MIIGESGGGRRRGHASVDYMLAAGSPSPGSAGGRPPQLQSPLPSPQGGVPSSIRTEYGSAYFRDGVASPKDHVLTKNAADRVRRPSDTASPRGHPSANSSPIPSFSGPSGRAGAPPLPPGGSGGAGPSPVGSGLKGRSLEGRHSDSPRTGTSAGGIGGAPGVNVFGQSMPRGQGSGVFGVGGSPAGHGGEAGGSGMSRGGSRVNDSRGVAAVLSSGLNSSPQSPLAHSGSAGRGRAPGMALSDHEAAMGDIVAGYGSCSLQGQRDYQEDTVAFLQGAECLAGGVFDGHGGDQVSKELERVLLQNILRAINELGKSDQDIMGPSPVNVQAAIARAYSQTNQDIATRVAAASEAGSCAVTFVVCRAAGVLHLFCGNAGDCRAVLYSGPAGARRAIRLSEDHKPVPQVCPAEIARVAAAGGCVLWGRVQGCLAVSRAFGDRALAPYVIADPYVSVRPVNVEQDMFLYMASDGVTDMVDDTLGCQVVADALARGSTCAQAAQALVNAAYHKGSSDNISAIVVRFRRR